MKICAIRVCNLASLKDAHRVDLDKGALGRVALFAITGPTGAGKSTLLDALCLALYDRIPRLQKAGGRVVRSEDDEQLTAKDVRSVLRHDTGQGYAEVEFVGIDGVRYRARWSVHRAGRKPSGKLQSQWMELEDLSTGQLLGSKGTPKTQTLEAIERRIGLSYDQFRRSVLLAQGDFAAFLKSAPGDRAALLEKMTGTEQYAQLSMAAYERAQTAAEVVNDLGRDLQNLGTLSATELGELQARAKAARAAKAEASAAVDALRAAEVWHATDQRLAAEVEQGREADAAAGAEASPEWETELQSALALEPLRPARDAVAAARRDLEAATTARDQANAQLEALRARRVVATEDERRTKADVERVQAEAQALAPALRRARALDGELAEARRAETERTAEQASARTTADQLLNETQAQRAALAAADARRKAASAKAEALSPWAALAELGDVLELAATPVGPEPEDVRARERAIRARLAEAGDVQADARRLEAWTHRAAVATLDERIQNGARTVAETSARREQQEKAFAQTQAAAALDDHRAQLVEGEPCPLCGALEHPAAGEAMTGLLRQLGEDLRRLQVDEQNYRAGLNRLEGERAGHLQALETLDAPGPPPSDLDAFRAEHAQREAQVTQALTDQKALAPLLAQAEQGAKARQARDAVRARLGPNLGAAFDADAVGFLAQAPARLAELTAARAEQTAADAAYGEAEQAHTALRGRAQQAELTAKNEASQAQAASANVARLAAERTAALQGTVDEVEARLAAQRDTAGAAHARATAALQEIDREAAQATARHQAAQSALDAAASRLDAGTRQLEADLAQRGLAEADLDAGLTWTAEQVRERSAELAARKQRAVRAAAVLAERTERLDAHRATPCPAAADPAAQAAAVEALERIAKDLAGLEHAAERHVQAVSKGADLRKQLDAAQARASAWERLNKVIGARNGARFRDFAQGLTLDRLLAHANRQLRDLAPRYALRRVPGHNLEIQVEDNAMAGDARSVASLSGGETFLVSLALALGLASMSSDTTQVESLFIDEGFGHLDQRSLELALATLDALQHKGRKVGVISHVQGLGDHIPVRIRIQRLAPGLSKVVPP